MARVIEDAAAGLAVPGLETRLVELAPGARLELSAEGETMAYVAGGRGESALGALDGESLLWLDPGDAVAVEAGPEGLRLLVAHAVDAGSSVP